MEGGVELVCELLGAVVEGVGSSGSGNKKESGCGCLFIFAILLGLVGWVGYLMYEDSEKHIKETKEVSFNNFKIDGMFASDQIGVHTSKGDTLIIISHDLYLNKKVGDSIKLKMNK